MATSNNAITQCRKTSSYFAPATDQVHDDSAVVLRNPVGGSREMSYVFLQGSCTQGVANDRREGKTAECRDSKIDETNLRPPNWMVRPSGVSPDSKIDETNLRHPSFRN